MPATTHHVLIVGIDGVRYDTLCRMPTPAIDSIAASGFLRQVRVNDAGPTISGPGWATIFTGVLATDHEITDNELSPNRLTEFPDIVRHTRTHLPDAATFVSASWSPLVSEASGGPLFADRGHLPQSDHQDSVQYWDELDEQVAETTVAFLADHDGSGGSLAVAYLGAPDEMAHELGASQTYEWSVRQADARVGRLLAEADRRRETHDEEWTVIVVTDHGHVDAGGHGGETAEERTAWIAARGPGIVEPSAATRLEQADVAGHTLSVLNLEPAAPDRTVGRRFGVRTG